MKSKNSLLPDRGNSFFATFADCKQVPIKIRRMKVRYIIGLSVCALLLLTFFQAMGITYAYHSQMRKTGETLASCFKESFCQAVDRQINSLPYPDWTITHVTYIPYALKLEDEDKFLYIHQQTSAVLQDWYRLPETSIDSLRSILQQILLQEEVKGSVCVRKLDTRTGKILATSPAEADISASGIGILTSPRAFLHEQNGIAVEAVLDTHYFDRLSNLLFPGVTFLLAILLTVAIVLRIYLLRHLQHDITRQCEDYYRLAEQMEQPVRQLEADLHAKRWAEAGTTGREMLADTEAVLTRAKQENAVRNSRHTAWLNRVSWCILPLSLLLPLLWASYIYHAQWKALNRETQVRFENAFNEEVNLRYLDYIRLNRIDRYAEFIGTTSEAQQHAQVVEKILYDIQTDEQGQKHYQVKVPAELLYIYVLKEGMDLRQGIRLYRAYGTQQSIDEECAEKGYRYVPLDTLRMDSLFHASLAKVGMNVSSGIRIIAENEVLKEAGNATPGRGSFVTTPLRMDEKGTVCVQGVVPTPQSYVFRSAQYLFLPLVLTFAFCLLCTAGHWFVWQRQRRLERFRKDFTYSMIHDMKSPLQSILMGTQMIGTGKLDDKPEKLARICAAMQEECTHLLNLPARVVMLTQIDRGELQLRRTDVLLLPLFEDLVDKFRLKTTKPVAFQTNCAEGLTAFADAFCLHEVLSNLIDNAIKYSGKEVRIRLTAGQTPEGDVCLGVRDNGIGIPPSEQRKIFGRFERVQANSRRTGASGFGLGLNFVWQVVQAHGGTVTVESDGKSFSEFVVTLPGKSQKIKGATNEVSE